MAATTVETQKATKLIAVLKRERPGHKKYRHTVGTEVLNVTLAAKDPTEKVKVKITPVSEPEVGEGAAPAREIEEPDATDLEVPGGEEGAEGIE